MAVARRPRAHQRNVIAHHNNLNHPDNIQTCCRRELGIVFDGNLILNGGQCFMLSETTDSVVRNNAILGSVCLLPDLRRRHGERLDVTQNTFGLTGYGACAWRARITSWRDNIFFTAAHRRLRRARDRARE